MYLAHISPTYALIKTLDNTSTQERSIIEDEGYVLGSDGYESNVSDLGDMMNRMSRLRDIGVLFSEGKNWSPADLFREHRDRGDLSGEFRSIGWHAPGKYRIRTDSNS